MTSLNSWLHAGFGGGGGGGVIGFEEILDVFKEKNRRILLY